MFASFKFHRKPTADARVGVRGGRSFAGDDKGSVAIMFAVIIFALCLFVGGAVDFARWSNARHHAAMALDAAALAGARSLLVTRNVEVSKTAARDFYLANVQGGTDILDEVVVFQASDNNEAFEGTGTAYIRPAFLSLAGINRLQLNTYARAVLPQWPLEVSLMLDVTGSMQGSKIRDLKEAAADLVDIVIKDNQREDLVRIAIVPFAEGVRLPSGAREAARGPLGSNVSVPVTRTRYRNRRWETYTENVTYRPTRECVVERKGSDRYTDAAPGPGNYVMTLYNSSGSCGLGSNAELVPLTGNKALLKNRIENLNLSVYTAGHLGTAWAWYTLSPNWNSLWDESAAASAYDDDTVKIAILMTDGDYNEPYDSQGIATRSEGAGSAVNGSSDSQARALCTSMKDKGIVVYTVGFAIGRGSSAERVLNFCASNETTAYTADNGNQLRETFRDIALRISNLYLTH